MSNQNGIRYSIAIASGKGGVWKSTVAVNLAVALARSGARTGLLDADIYGPSIPIMTGVQQMTHSRNGKIIPLEAHGVRLMPLGFLMPDGVPTVLARPHGGRCDSTVSARCGLGSAGLPVGRSPSRHRGRTAHAGAITAPHGRHRGPDATRRGDTDRQQGAGPQDIGYRDEETYLIIGNDNVIRESASLHRATTKADRTTVIANNNFLMGYSHVAHDCKLGNGIIMANSATLGGHITVADFAILGGIVGVHQFVRIGAYAMVGGQSAISQDIPPFVSASGNRAQLYGLNLVGLKRRGFSDGTIASLKKAYEMIFRSALSLEDALKNVVDEFGACPECSQEFYEVHTFGAGPEAEKGHSPEPSGMGSGSQYRGFHRRGSHLLPGVLR